MPRTSTKTKSKPSEKDLLSAFSKKKSSTSKTTIPAIDVDDARMISQIRDIIRAKEKEAAAKSLVASSQDRFRDTAREHFEDRCREDGKVHSSVRFTAQEGEKMLRLLYTQQSKINKMDEEEVSDSLASIFGNDFNKYFKSQRTLEIDTSVLTRDQTIKVITAIQKALTPKVAKAALNSTLLLLPKDQYFIDRVLNDETRIKSKKAEKEGYAVLRAASFQAK